MVYNERKFSWYAFAIAILILCHCFSVIPFYGQPASKGGFRTTPQGVEGQSGSFYFQVWVYDAEIIRVRVSRSPILSDFSYLLSDKATPKKENTRINRTPNGFQLNTGRLVLDLETLPVIRASFKALDGTVINEDLPGRGFGTGFLGERPAIYKKMQPGERFVGLGEALGNLDKSGMAFTLNNTDTYKYGDPRLPMYLNVPFYMGMHGQNVYGLFFHNTHAAHFNFGVSTPFLSITASGGDADYFFISGKTLADILAHYTHLTGRMGLPPRWSLGYHQSRCSYSPQETVAWIGESFRRKKIPLDCIVLDADYQLHYQPFRIDMRRFPDLQSLSNKLNDQGIELTASVYPGVKIDTSYASYREGLAKDLFLKYPNGSVFQTEIAPLQVVLPDYSNPTTRLWWKSKMKWLPDHGIHGYWNDMNEPAVGGSYLPENLQFDFDGRKANALEAKNLYGMLMARSSFEAALQNSPGRRPFILTRSGYAGIQRYSAVWSGDNTTSNEGLLSSVLLNNQLGLSGIPFCGYDIGGFIGSGSKELFVRWLQAGVFSPFCRNHKGCGEAAGEPWAFGEEAEAISRNYIGLRYRLMPYIYSAFYEASQSGLPVAKSLCMSYPFEPRVYDPSFQYQFLFGNDFMVAPLTANEFGKKIFLPGGNWYNVHNGALLKGNTEHHLDFPLFQLPIFIRASGIVPMQSLVQSAREAPDDTLSIHLFKGTEANSFTYYEDAGDGFSHEQGNYCKRVFRFSPFDRSFVLEQQQGSFQSHFNAVKLVFHGFEVDELVRMQVNENSATVKMAEVPVLDALAGLEVVYEKNYYETLRGKISPLASPVLTFPNSRSAISVTW